MVPGWPGGRPTVSSGWGDRAAGAAAQEGAAGRPADCSAEASAVQEAQERLDQIRS
jgi:hypothetical protein